MQGIFRTGLAAIAAFAVAATSGAASAQSYRIETVAENLRSPWSVAFLPSGDMLVTEKIGRLRIIRDGELVAEPVTGLPSDIYDRGQAGLFDVALDPEFENNGIIYLSYAGGTDRANATTVVRAKFDGAALTEVTQIFRATPDKAGGFHFGGRLLPMADGTLFISLGEGARYREEAQSVSSHLGTIVRVNTDGSIPEGNPFVGQEGALPEIWSYGHRNVQGLTRDPATGRIYAHEHGARGGDEVNLVEPGLNYGWPAITYGIDYSGAEITPYTELPGMEQPLTYWVPSIAPSGLAFYSGDLFPEWQGDLFAGALAGQKVQRVVLEGGKVVREEAMFTEIGARIRDVRMGPDGALYILTDEGRGRLLKVVPD